MTIGISRCFVERFPCSRAAGISSTAARCAACSAAGRSALATATLNFGAPLPASTSARNFAPTTPTRRSFASVAPPYPRPPRSSPAQPTSEAICLREPGESRVSLPPSRSAFGPICRIAGLPIVTGLYSRSAWVGAARQLRTNLGQTESVKPPREVFRALGAALRNGANSIVAVARS